ncbi:hypothetical protein BgiBS90_015169, partial [Biomphalaria glabrata]
ASATPDFVIVSQDRKNQWKSTQCLTMEPRSSRNWERRLAILKNNPLMRIAVITTVRS